ncbi:MAG TPA: hypothetical protein PK052_01515 [Anaerohalosphaeraceae bacterium]|nr:hypothetical protein [Anaerohalosphaeraceae bacterium]
MKTLNLKYSVRFIARFFVFVVLLSNVFVLSGCASGLGLLFSPGAFEKKTTPDYNLKEQEKRKILVWIECRVRPALITVSPSSWHRPSICI